jgi:hypothetical protein
MEPAIGVRAVDRALLKKTRVIPLVGLALLVDP